MAVVGGSPPGEGEPAQRAGARRSSAAAMAASSTLNPTAAPFVPGAAAFWRPARTPQRLPTFHSDSVSGALSSLRWHCNLRGTLVPADAITTGVASYQQDAESTPEQAASVGNGAEPSVSLSDLPAAVLGIVLSNLPCPRDVASCAVVSKLFHTVAGSAPLTLVFSDALATSAKPLEYDTQRVSQIAGGICSAFSGIRQLDLQCCPVTDANMRDIMTALPRLDELVLSGCRKLSPGVTSRMLDSSTTSAGSSGHHQLRTLMMQRCYQLTASSLDAALQHSQQHRLSCVAFSHLSLEEWPGQLPEVALPAASLVPALRGLSILALNNCTNLSTAGLQALARMCPALRYLLLGGSNLVRSGEGSPGPLRAAISAAACAAAQPAPESSGSPLERNALRGTAQISAEVATELLSAIAGLPCLEVLELTFFRPEHITLCQRLLPQFCPGRAVALLDFCSPSFPGHVAMLPLDGRTSAARDLRLALGAAANCSNPVRQSPLHVASELSALASAQLLLDLGAAVDAKDRSISTPLFRACEAGHHHMARLLLDAGADPGISNSSGESPLYIACLRGHLRSVKALLSHFRRGGIAWESGDLYSDGWTPLMAATVGNHLPIVLELIRAAGPLSMHMISATNRYGQTALHLAARRGSLPFLQLMLEAGGVMFASAPDCSGHRAADVAGQHGHPGARKMLLQAQRCAA
mmetsp:Transcript_17593/g.44655  ORF Transcript_17593/g.44655 Transcript_17593/m.44655 type:complete len:696 (-) Transcript_17593:24-2111(-)